MMSHLSTPIEAINTAYNTAHNYFSTHVTKKYTWRHQQLERLLALVQDNENVITDALKSDLNKPHFEGSFTEVVTAIADIKATLRELESWMAPISVPTPASLLPGSSYLIHEPKGTILIIAPFNYPFQLTLIPLCAALAAGNTVVIKPSEMTPASTTLLTKLIPKYLDPSAVHIIPGAIAETTHLLTLKWDHIFFTGSEAIGKVVMRAAAEHLTPCTLELGGKSPTIIDASADITLAARRVSWAKYLNAGQSCIAPDYVLVHKSIHKEFVEAMKQQISTFYGSNPATSPDFARIINERHTQRIAALIDAHKDKVVAGGTYDISQRYIAPTILDNIKYTDTVMESEIFGPVFPIIEFDDIHQIIKYINERPKPLALYIFSNDDTNIRTVLEQTSSGGVSVNDALMHFANPNLPFGGVGTSGYGAYHGKYGFETFSHAKPVLHKSRWLDAPARYPPYDNTKYTIFRYASEIYRVNSESVAKTLKVVFLPIATGVIARRLGITIGFRSKL